MAVSTNNYHWLPDGTIGQVSGETNKTTKKNNDVMGKDEFLKLLVTQLRYQDPLNPMEDKEFIAQTAQFSALEQMMNMSKSFEQMQALSYLNKHVIANDPKTGELYEGIITETKYVDGECKVTLFNEQGTKEFALKDIQAVTIL